MPAHWRERIFMTIMTRRVYDLLSALDKVLSVTSTLAQARSLIKDSDNLLKIDKKIQNGTGWYRMV
jgi:hypothetical protein